MNQHVRNVLTLLGVLAAMAMIGFLDPAQAGINCTVSMTNIPFSSIDVLPGAAFGTTGTITARLQHRTLTRQYLRTSKSAASESVCGSGHS